MTVQTDKSGKPVQASLAWGLALLSLGYMLPWAIAATRGKSNAGAIGMVNLLLGWTLIGWVVALVMAAGSHQAGGAVQVVVQPSGGAAGWYATPDGQRYWDGAAWTEGAR